MLRRYFLGRVLAGLAALVCSPFVSRTVQAPGPALVPVYRWEGNAWRQLRMFELKVGDLCRIGGLTGQYRVATPPRVNEDTRVWGVESQLVPSSENRPV